MSIDRKLKIGDIVIVKGFSHKTKVCRIFMENSRGEETEYENECARVRAELDWGEFGKSKVSMHDENVTWFRLEKFN
jgi:hypothetical protein